MKVFLKPLFWLSLTAFTAVMVAGQPQQSRFPEGAGRPILERACGACHAPDPITQYHFATAAEYKDIVDSMIGSGAQVSAAELPVLVDYLFTNYGKKAEGAAAPAAGAAAAATPDPGKAILEAACTVCHGLDGLANHVYDTKEPYKSLVTNMVAYGASVTDAQMEPLVDYMFKTYGKK